MDDESRTSKMRKLSHVDDSSSQNDNVMDGGIHIEFSSEEYDNIVKSDAFIDKILFIKEFTGSPRKGGVSSMKEILVTAPNRTGKSVIMNMTKKFFEIMVDEKGSPIICVTKNEFGRWTEDENKTATVNFKLFKDNNLKIYQCHCEKMHTDEEQQNGLCPHRQFFYEHCGQHPVIFFNLKNVTCGTMEELKSSLKTALHETFEEHKYLGIKATSRLSESLMETFNDYYDEIKYQHLSDEDVKYGLRFLTKCLHTQFNRKVIVLVDECDAPLMHLLHKSRAIHLTHIEKVIEILGMMFASVLKSNPVLLGTLINACVLMATTLSPYANNLDVYPFLENHRFSSYYGFTKDEVDMLLNKPKFRGFDEDGILSYYNGYEVLDYGTRIYTTYSFLKYLQQWDMDRNEQKKKNAKSPDKKKHKPVRYWTENHGVAQLEELFANETIRSKIDEAQARGEIQIYNPVYKMSPKHVLALKSAIQCPDDTNCDLLFMYLKDRGYFNITHKNLSCCTLKIPTGEIQDEISQKFYDVNYYKKKYKFTSEQIQTYCHALDALDGNNEESVQRFVDSITHLFPKERFMPINHDEFKAILFAFALHMKTKDTRSEIFCQSGIKFRLDLLVHKIDGSIIIIEVKWGATETALDGLKQIFTQEYYKVFEKYDITNKKIYVGLHFNDRKIATACVFTTDNIAVVESFGKIDMTKVIEKCSPKPTIEEMS